MAAMAALLMRQHLMEDLVTWVAINVRINLVLYHKQQVKIKFSLWSLPSQLIF